MHRILIVEDSNDSFVLIKRALSGTANVDWSKSLAETFRLLDSKSYDLFILDVMLPDGDGYRICSTLQNDDRFKYVPVFFLTSKNSTADKVLGFSVGADDFVTKPFDQTEFKARIEAKLRKKDRERRDADVIKHGDLEICRSTQNVSVFAEGVGSKVDLTAIEFRILLFLANNVATVFSRAEILDAIWGSAIHVYSRSVDTHISKLRRKLGAVANYVQSVHGCGYRFVPDEIILGAHLKPPPHILAAHSSHRI